MIALRLATAADLAIVLPRTRALNAHELIDVSDAVLERALGVLFADPAIGGVWLVERDRAVIGYALVTYCFDLEFGGREAWMTELWIDEPERGRGAATEVLALLDAELRARGVGALHLQVRAENRAMRLYERAGFERVPRIVMTRRL